MTASRGHPPNLPGFEFIKPIGEGGFADVFLYRQLRPLREVAVKVLIESSLDGEGLELFNAEADVMAQLSGHPSIVPIYLADVAPDGRPYLVMEYCPPPHLATRYRSEQISLDEALETAIKIASAVETAHRAGILHRDIKPHNILTSAYGAPMLTDFGIAGTMGEGSTWSGGMSIPWSPPEAFWDEPPADVRSDVYSLASTTYTLLAGRSPFEIGGGANDNATLMARIERQALSPLTRSDVSDELNDVLARAMAKQVEERHPTAMAFARALQDVQEWGVAEPTMVEVLDASGATANATVDDDRTRVRPVQVIVPEAIATIGTRLRPIVLGPRVELSDVAPMSAPASPDTMARGGKRSVDQGSQGSVVALAPRTDAEPVDVDGSEGSRAKGVVVGLLAVVIAGIGSFALWSSGADEPPSRVDQAGETGDPQDATSGGADLLSPTEVQVRLDEGDVVVTWESRSSKDGDTFRVEDQNGDPIGRADERRFVVAADAFPACVQIRVIRDRTPGPESVCEPLP